MGDAFIRCAHMDPCLRRITTRSKTSLLRRPIATTGWPFPDTCAWHQT